MQFCQGIPYPRAACRDRPSPPPLIQRAAVNGLLPDRDADRHMSTFPHCANGKDSSGHGIQCQLRNRDVPVHQYIRCKRFRHRLIPPFRSQRPGFCTLAVMPQPSETANPPSQSFVTDPYRLFPPPLGGHFFPSFLRASASFPRHCTFYPSLSHLILFLF